MWCFKKYIIPMKWLVIGYMLILSVFVPGFVQMVSFMTDDIESLVILMMHLFIIPLVIIKVIQSMYIKWWVLKVGVFKRVHQIGDRLMTICIYICILLQVVFTIMYVVTQDYTWLFTILINYLVFININVPNIYISKEHLIINRLLFETKSITKIKRNKFRLYIKTKDNSVYRVWCRGQKAAEIVEQNIQVLTYESLSNYH